MREEFFWILFTGVISMGMTVLLSLPNKVGQEIIFLSFVLGMLMRTLLYIFEEAVRISKHLRGVKNE